MGRTHRVYFQIRTLGKQTLFVTLHSGRLDVLGLHAEAFYAQSKVDGLPAVE